MSEELLQRDLISNPEKIGKWNFYNIGSTTVKALKGYRIIRNIDYGKVENKKIDALIVLNKQVIAVIEYKNTNQFKTKAQKDKAIKQEIEVAEKLGSKIIIATDTKECIWVNTKTGNRIKDEDGKEIKYLFDPKDEKIVLLIEKINYSINELNDNLKPKKLVNPTDLAKQIWQDIWSVSGATPENCLYTFVELFIFKYLSDLKVLKGIHNFYTLLNMYKENTEDEVLQHYADNIRPKIKDLFPRNEDDKTTIINGTIFVSKDQKAVKGYSTVFKKVLEKFKDYGELENIDYDFKSQLFESFLKESISKKNWGQFFTPLKVVRAIVEMAKDEIKDGSSICDPACGVGKFLLEPIVTRLDSFYKIGKKDITPKITIHGFDKGFDKDEQKTIILAKANMLIYFSDLIKDNPGLTKDFAKIFNESFILKTNSILGTLSEPTEKKYDLILTNPPYVTSGSSNLKEEIKKDGELVNYYKINSLGVEGLFMEWIVRALKPRGKAFVVIPDGILNRQNDKHLRKFILDECYLDGLISLPTKTFFTTPKKTYILCITKKNKKEDIQNTPIFTYLVSEVGETRDIYRFDIEQNDLQEAVTLFSFFKGNKNNFSKINTDKRCKIQPTEKFIPENHWSVDRWWSKDEQIELGVIEEDKSVTIEEFSDIIQEISETLSDFSGLLKEVSEKKKEIAKFNEIALSENEYFKLSIGKRVVKRDIVNISGDIPIYSANVKNPVGYHNKSNISNFENNFVLWGIDGDFEFNFIPKNTPFVSTDHCGVIRILNDTILPEYLMLQLESIKYKYGFDRELRASLKNMSAVKISIPLNLKGEIDIEKQQEIVEKYQVVEEAKNKVKEYKEKINKISIEIENKYEIKEKTINEIFNLVNGNSKITNKFVNQNKGALVVYSSNTKNNGILGHINSFDHEIECIQMTTNGVYAGTVFYREKHKFSINGDARLLVTKFKDLYYSYLMTEVKKAFLNHKFSWENKPTVSKIKNIKIPIPINKKGEFDLEAQKQIAEKYKKIEEIKSTINKELDKIQNTEIEIG